MKAFKTRIYPTEYQAKLIEKTLGCCRWVYNNGLAFKIAQYKDGKKKVGAYDLINKLPEQKKEFEWLKEVDSQSLQQSLLDLNCAYNYFFQKVCGFPSFHKKGQKDSYRTTIAKRETKHGIKIPKVGTLKTAEPIKKKWNIHNATISKRAGKYFISLLIDFTPNKVKHKDKAIGIDLGIKTFAVLSNGIEYDNIKTTKQYETQLARAQRRLSKMQKGSNNYHKQKIKVGRIYLKISNVRNDYLNKISTAIAKQYELIAVEDLNISGMIKNHSLAKSIADCSWGEFVRQLEYKSLWYGGAVKKIGRFEPSSKTCSACGYVMDKMPLNIRKWTCPCCGETHDRDVNAAKNILKIALAGSEGEPVDTYDIGRIEQENLKVAQ